MSKNDKTNHKVASTASKQFSTSLSSHYQHWHLTLEDEVLWLCFDRADKSTNVINSEVLAELDAILSGLATQTKIRALIIASAKENGFIAGADIEQFTHCEDEKAALIFIQQGQRVFEKLATLSIATVAVVNGFCLGGGLELALACRYRVAADTPQTKLGLPEVMLGVHPGWGGSVRLPRLIGAAQAFDLMLSGRTVSGKAAAQMGIVDVAVPVRDLIRAASYYAQQQPMPHQASKVQTFSNHPFVRPLLGKFLRQKLSQKVNPDHYPAPFALLENWQREGVSSEQAFNVEATSVAKLAVTTTARNLVRIFLLRDHLKGLGKERKITIHHVHVVGAGTMGGDIAAWCALQGLQVTLQDREPKFIAPAIKRASQLFKKKLKSPRLIQAAMDRLMPDVDGLGIAKADVIIEAIFEDLKAKQKLFKELEAHAKPEAILATNTSSIPLDQINNVLQHPERLVGLHFFNPVAMMQLIEVVQGQHTAAPILKQALAFVHQLDKLPLPVLSHPGFLVNRVLMPYLLEAVLMIEEDIAPSVIDQAALTFGMPMGPIELADTVGLDVCLAVAQELSKHFGSVVSERLLKMVKDGKLGRKSGKGFYVYQNGKALKGRTSAQGVNPHLAERLILRMLNEAVACLREQVVADADLLDAGMVFGTGFAPFRGGPLHYAEACGIKNIVSQLQQFASQYGPRFKPDAGWEQME